MIWKDGIDAVLGLFDVDFEVSQQGIEFVV